MVTAQDAARRRIERDLHDGAQQRLLALGAELGGIAQRTSSADDDLARARRGTGCWRRPRSCGCSPAGSTRRCSLRTGSPPPSRRWPTPRRSRSASTCACPTGFRRRSRRRRTSWRARRSPTPHGTPARASCA
ncbi:histidine kinase [Nocardioides sp. J54]|uniref:histidine kinase n=1 Tax=Nocardioides sp. J54 TaxID=935866 RepID=UPI003FA5B7B1